MKNKQYYIGAKLKTIRTDINDQFHFEVWEVWDDDLMAMQKLGSSLGSAEYLSKEKGYQFSIGPFPALLQARQAIADGSLRVKSEEELK